MTQKDQPNVPKLRFREFSEAWEGTRIGDIGTFFYGKSAPKFSLVESGGTPCVRYGELYSLYDAVISKVVSQTSVPRKNLRFSKGGEILVPRVGEDPMDFAANSSFLPLKDIAIGEMISAFRTKEDPVFFTHYFRTRKKQFARVVEGGNVSNLYYSYLESIEIGRPSLHEQRKIASFLSAVDTKIAQLSRKKALFEDYKKGCMQQLFSQKIRFKDDNGKDFPDWEEKRLGEVADTFGGLTGKVAEDFGTGARFVTYLQVFNASEIYPDQCGFVEIKPGERQQKVQRGDIIFTTSSETPFEVGFASVVTTDLHDTYLNSFCFGLRPRSIEELLPNFSRYLFRSADYRKKVIPLAQGSTRYNLSKVSFLKIRLHIPHPDEQRKIADFLSALDRKIELVGKELEHAKTFKKGLLQQIFV